MRNLRTRWGCISVLFLVAVAIIWSLAAPTGTNPGASRATIHAVEDQLGDDWRRDAPPIDLEAVARFARGVPGLNIPIDRAIGAWRHSSGAQATGVALRMASEEEARALLSGRVSEMIASRFDLEPEPVSIPSFPEAVGFRAPAYYAVAARHGSAVLFIGTTNPELLDATSLLTVVLGAAATSSAETAAVVE